MLFPTFEFFLFFAVILILNWGLKRWPLVWRIFLLVSSYYFYLIWDLKFLYILIGVSLFNFFTGLLIDKFVLKSKIILAISVLINLSVLGLFKYYDFFRVSLESFLSKFNLPASLPLLEIILPIGLSFYIFRVISYNIDIYRLKIKATHSLLDFFIYVSFFPQLLSGPIARASEFLPQLANGGSKRINDFYENLSLIVLGLFKKIIVSSYLVIYLTDDVFAVPENHSSLVILMAYFAYCFVIYFDFSSYSDMAIGFAGMMGFKSPVNFNTPYLSLNIVDFWRRWHITLSYWFRDYLYIPLGGNRKGKLRKYLNLFIVMVLAGLWHGASTNFLIWGALHGTALLLTHALHDYKENKYGLKSPGLFKKIICWFLTFNFITFSWIFFRIESFSKIVKFISSLFSNYRIVEPFPVYAVYLLLIAFIFIIFEKNIINLSIKLYQNVNFLFLVIIVILIIIFIFSLGPNTVPNFIYFSF